jgi:hypothetical protein
MKIKKDVLIQKMGDTFVAYDNETSTLHEFNEIGFLILSGIKKKKSKQGIIKEIISKHKVSKNKTEEDYEEFVEILKTKDLIVGKK